MKIVRFKPDYVNDFKSVLNILYKVFGDKVVIMYAIINDNTKLDLICRSGNKVLYLDNGETLNISSYSIDDNYDIKFFAYNNVEYSLTDRFVCAIRDGVMEETLALRSDLDDDDPYAGHITYTQYNNQTDVEANMKFSHPVVIREDGYRPRIYEYHLNDIYSLIIDEQAKKKPFDWGIIGRKHKYFAHIDINPETYDIDILAIKRYGLGEYLHKGAYSLLRDDELRIYSRGYYLSKDGSFRYLWPLGYPYKQEELKDILKSYSFQTSIPKDLLDVYNGDHFMLRKVGNVLKEVQKIEKDKALSEDIAALIKVQP